MCDFLTSIWLNNSFIKSIVASVIMTDYRNTPKPFILFTLFAKFLLMLFWYLWNENAKHKSKAKSKAQIKRIKSSPKKT
jgi:hypothetical protein